MNDKNETQNDPRLWGDKRYHSLNYHLRHVFGEKVFKVSLNGGFTCPNRDGGVGYGGCVFCSLQGSGDFAGKPNDPLGIQFKQGVLKVRSKWPGVKKYIAYFQAFTNTYAPVEQLRNIYGQALEIEGVEGLAIATRPDCLPEDVLDLLSELNERTYLWVELGLQTSNNKTGRIINRGYNSDCFLESVRKLQSFNVATCVHIILGLPGEDRQHMMRTAKYVASTHVEGIKIHLLHLVKDTPLVQMYEKGQFEFLSSEAYIDLVVDILEILPPEMVIHRLMGDAPKETLIGPLWCRRKREILSRIDGRLKDRQTWQGRLYRTEKGEGER